MWTLMLICLQLFQAFHDHPNIFGNHDTNRFKVKENTLEYEYKGTDTMSSVEKIEYNSHNPTWLLKKKCTSGMDGLEWCPEDGPDPVVNKTVCPELHNKTFTNQAPFDILGFPECDLKTKLKIYLPENKELDINATSCDIDIRFFPSNETRECLDLLKRRKDVNKVAMITHGWMQKFEAEWMHKMKDSILEEDTSNGGVAVIIVGWNEDGNTIDDLFNYIGIAADTRYIGYGLSLVATEIKKHIPRHISLHCIGHSLGAHVCGFAGKYLRELNNPDYLMDRISGLDPAGPRFCEDAKVPYNYSYVDPRARLGPQDAKNVDVIHTDGHRVLADGAGFFNGHDVMHYGTMMPLGTVDFYPGSIAKHGPHGPWGQYGFCQPGCTCDESLSACSHCRSHVLFKQSIDDKKAFPVDSVCKEALPFPTNCTKLASNYISNDKEHIKTNSVHQAHQPRSKMGYWADSNTKGIFTVPVSLGPYPSIQLAILEI